MAMTVSMTGTHSITIVTEGRAILTEAEDQSSSLVSFTFDDDHRLGDKLRRFKMELLDACEMIDAVVIETERKSPNGKKGEKKAEA